MILTSVKSFYKKKKKRICVNTDGENEKFLLRTSN